MLEGKHCHLQTKFAEAHGPKRFAWAVFLFLLVISALLYVGTASGPALLDDDVDAAHAVVAREMLQRHDYAVLHLNGIRYLVRAPLHFWMIASSYALFGETEFATHLPLALSVVALVLTVFEFGRKFFSTRAGLYAALIIATSPGTYIFTRTVNPEAICALELSAAFYLFLRSWTGSLDRRIGYWGAAGLCAAAVLTRGLIGLLFPLGVIIAFLSITRSWRRWRELRPLSSLLIFLVIAVPWHIVAEMRAPGFFWEYFINDHVKRALGTRWPPDYSAVPLGLWWIAHLAWLFPWILFAPLLVRAFLAREFLVCESKDARKRQGEENAASQARLLLLAWAGFVLLFFSVESGSRMEYYSLSAWPAIALLLGWGLARSEQTGDTLLRTIQRILAVLGAGIAILLGRLLWLSSRVPVAGDISTLLQSHPAQYYRFAMAHLFDLTLPAFADLRQPAIIAAVAFLLTFTAAWILRERGLPLASNMALAVGMGVFILAAHLAYKVFEPQLSSRTLAMEINKYARVDDQLVVYGDFAASSSVAFYTRRKLWLYNAPYSELEYGSQFADSPRVFLNDQDFLGLWRGRTRVFLIVPPDQRQSVMTRLPLNATWFLAESGGKIAYVNQPLSPNQLSVDQTVGYQKNKQAPSSRTGNVGNSN